MIEVIVLQDNSSSCVFGEMRGDCIMLEGVPVPEGVGTFVVDGVRSKYSAVLEGTAVLLEPYVEVQDVPVV